MREVIMTGKTVEEATELALAELGVAAEDASVEVLELPHRRFFKTRPAKVRVSVEEPEAPEKTEAPAPAPKTESLCRKKQNPRRSPLPHRWRSRRSSLPPKRARNRRRPRWIWKQTPRRKWLWNI